MAYGKNACSRYTLIVSAWRKNQRKRRWNFFLASSLSWNMSNYSAEIWVIIYKMETFVLEQLALYVTRVIHPLCIFPPPFKFASRLFFSTEELQERISSCMSHKMWGFFKLYVSFDHCICYNNFKSKHGQEHFSTQNTIWISLLTFRLKTVTLLGNYLGACSYYIWSKQGWSFSV